MKNIKKKLLLLPFVLLGLLGASVVYGQVSNGVGSPQFFKLGSGGLNPVVSTWTIGSSGSRVAKGWFTDFDTTTITIGATTGGNLNVNGKGLFGTAATTTISGDTASSTFVTPISSVSGNLTIGSAGTTNNLLFQPYGGNVGIGTTTPTTLLGVQGAGLFSGNVSMAGLTATGTVSFATALGTPSGGTGVGTFTSNGVLYGNGTGNILVTAQGASGTVLHGNAGVPSFSAVSLTADVSGILPTANGGTGIAYFTAAGPTAARIYTFPDAAATVLTTNAAVTVAQGGTGVGTFTSNGVLYGNGTGNVLVTAQGASGTVLHGNGGVPSFSATSLTADVSGILPTANGGTGIAFFTAAGPTVARVYTFPDAAATVLTTNAAVTVAQGGTGVGTFTSNGVLYGNGTGNMLVTGQGAANTILTANAGAPSFSATPTIGTSVTVPLAVGGTAVGSSLSLQSTSGVGTTDFIKFLVGNNGGTEAARITDAGNVGIGTTSPMALLAVSGSSAWSTNVSSVTNFTDTGTVGSGLTLSSTGTGGRIYSILSTANSAGAGGGKFALLDSIAGAFRMTVDSSGKVGIGTTSPAAELAVSSTATSTLHLGTGQSTTKGSCIQMYSPNGTAYRLYVANGGTLTTESGACK